MKKLLYLMPFILITGVMTTASVENDIKGFIGDVKQFIEGDGKQQKQERTLASFDKIYIDKNAKVNVTVFCHIKNKKPNIIIEAGNKILGSIVTEMSKDKPGQLNISFKDGVVPRKTPEIILYSNGINTLNVLSPSRVNLMDLKNSNTDINIRSASVTADGRTDNLNLTASGACSVSLKNLKARKAKVSSTGANLIDIFVSDDLDLNMTGLGKLDYYGNPKKIKKNIAVGATAQKK